MLNFYQKLLLLFSSLFFAFAAFAADPIPEPETNTVVTYGGAADLSSSVTGITTIAIAVGGAFIVLAITRMVYRKIRGVARG